MYSIPAEIRESAGRTASNPGRLIANIKVKIFTISETEGLTGMGLGTNSQEKRIQFRWNQVRTVESMSIHEFIKEIVPRETYLIINDTPGIIANLTVINPMLLYKNKGKVKFRAVLQ